MQNEYGDMSLSVIVVISKTWSYPLTPPHCSMDTIFILSPAMAAAYLDFAYLDFARSVVLLEYARHPAQNHNSNSVHQVLGWVYI